METVSPSLIFNDSLLVLTRGHYCIGRRKSIGQNCAGGPLGATGTTTEEAQVRKRVRKN